MLRAARCSVVLLALAAGPGIAEMQDDDPASAARSATIPDHPFRPLSSSEPAIARTLSFQTLPARFQYRPNRRPQKRPYSGRPTAPADHLATNKTRMPTAATVAYRDRAALINRLRELDGLRLLTFWENRLLSVFFGVSRDGFAGLNIRQRSQDEAAGQTRKGLETVPAEELMVAHGLAPP